jgi:hypothetical protein
MTSAFEAEVLRHALGPARAVLGIRTRHKKERPPTYPFRFGKREDVSAAEVPVRDHPGTFAFPVFSALGVVPVTPIIPGTTVVRFATATRLTRLRQLAASFRATTMVVRYPEPVAFARFLAKIAHCFAVACVGVHPCLTTPLLEALLAGDATIFAYVGNDAAVQSKTLTSGVNDVALVQDEHGVLCHIRLLAPLRTPEYLVRVTSTPLDLRAA